MSFYKPNYSIIRMLQDKLITGTGSFRDNPIYAKYRGFPVGPRELILQARQEPLITGNEFSLAHMFIGVPADEEYLQQVRKDHNLSDNYGIVFMPKFRLKDVDVSEIEGILESSSDDGYRIIGLLPHPNLKAQSIGRGYLLHEEGIVYVSIDKDAGKSK